MVAKIASAVWVLLIFGALRIDAAQGSPTNGLPNETEVRNLLVERIKALGGERGGVGIVVGLISPEGRQIISAGSRSSHDPRVLDGDTVFEIGSVTKAFTALLLADMAVKNELGLND